MCTILAAAVPRHLTACHPTRPQIAKAKYKLAHVDMTATGIPPIIVTILFIIHYLFYCIFHQFRAVLFSRHHRPQSTDSPTTYIPIYRREYEVLPPQPCGAFLGAFTFCFFGPRDSPMTFALLPPTARLASALLDPPRLDNGPNDVCPCIVGLIFRPLGLYALFRYREGWAHSANPCRLAQHKSGSALSAPPALSR